MRKHSKFVAIAFLLIGLHCYTINAKPNNGFSHQTISSTNMEEYANDSEIPCIEGIRIADNKRSAAFESSSYYDYLLLAETASADKGH